MQQEQMRDEVLETICQYSRLSREALLAADPIDDVIAPVVVIELVFELEEKYGMEIDDREVLTIETADDLVDCVLRRLDVAA